MSSFIQNLRRPIDSINIALIARKLDDPAKAPVYAKECIDIVEKAPTKEIKAELCLKIASEMKSHAKDEKVRCAAAATLNLKDSKYDEATIAACHAALSMLSNPVSGPTDSALCSAALAAMEEGLHESAEGIYCERAVADAFSTEIVKQSSNQSVKTALQCAMKLSEKSRTYAFATYEATLDTCSRHSSYSREKMLAASAAECAEKDPSGYWECGVTAKTFLHEIAAVTKDDKLRTVVEAAAEVSDAAAWAYTNDTKGLIVSDIIEVVDDVIEKSNNTENPADVLAFAEQSLFLKWADNYIEDPLRKRTEEIFRTAIEKADREYYSRKSVNEMAEALSGRPEAPEIEEQDDFILIDGVKLDRRQKPAVVTCRRS